MSLSTGMASKAASAGTSSKALGIGSGSAPEVSCCSIRSENVVSPSAVAAWSSGA